jgi:hypothetical protein
LPPFHLSNSAHLSLITCLLVAIVQAQESRIVPRVTTLEIEIYVILQKSAKENVQSPLVDFPSPTASQPSMEELRQLMQLQNELSQTTVSKPTPE